MTEQRKWEIFGFVAVLMIGAIFCRGWQLEREARTTAEAAAAAQQRIIAQQAEAIAARDAANQTYVQGLTSAARAIQTPAQAAQVIVRYLPAAPAGDGAPAQPQSIATVARADLPAATQQQLPPAASYGILTDSQLQQVARNDLACDAAQHSLTTCQADKLDQAAQLDASQKETAAWKTAAQGGTRFQRFMRVAKFVGCAGLGAGAGAIADKKSPALGAPIGAAAGVTVCSIF